MIHVTETIKYVGVNDHQVDLFEGQYVVPNGMSYNSYVIDDDKIAVMDTVDIHFTHAVSYTHLDVYKRQNFHFRPVGKPAPPLPLRPLSSRICITSSGFFSVSTMPRAS